MPAFRCPGALCFTGFIWGLAEATVFFVVPDVLLTFVALRRGGVPALIVMLFVVAGALLGGLAMWWHGATHPVAAIALLDAIPAISPRMIEEASASLADDPFAALLGGSFSGVPYKVYAATAAGAGVSAPWFLLITIPARAARFVAAIAAAAIAGRILRSRLSPTTATRLLAGFWILFYAAFWSLMPS